jgi:3-phenylpropionate/trans-cinnamate dioxygenase ferredoxin subunit
VTAGGNGGIGTSRASRACALSDVPAGGALGVQIDGEPVVIVRAGSGADERVFALRDVCSHAEVPLSEGDVEVSGGDCTIECWLHGSRFDVRTGAPTGLPATEPVPVYRTTVADGDVYVELGGSDPTAEEN